ncbi:MAG: glutaredoxin domain-containing protein, partial [Alphaproteobacteria bacterium]
AEMIDKFLPINGNDAMDYSRQLARREGIFTGVSGGATFAGAMAIANQAEPGTTILAMLPDTGERYLSTPLFADVPEDMTDAEIEISQSTPRYRFDVSAPPPENDDDKPAAPPPPAESVDPAAAAKVEAIVADADNPVVMFSHEWCEFCWSVRNMFAEANIPYRTIDLDSAALQEDNMGRKLRVALCERTGIQTIPQIFVGGELIGGCTETFDAFKDGSFGGKLAALDVAYDTGFADDPYSFLPKWLHPR